MSQDQNRGGRLRAADDAAASGASGSPATGTFETTPIDPVISEPTIDTSLIPVVRPAEEHPEQDEGFVKHLTGSIATKWRSAAEEAHLEWQEYDAEAAARADLNPVIGDPVDDRRYHEFFTSNPIDRIGFTRGHHH